MIYSREYASRQTIYEEEKVVPRVYFSRTYAVGQSTALPMAIAHSAYKGQLPFAKNFVCAQVTTTTSENLQDGLWPRIKPCG